VETKIAPKPPLLGHRWGFEWYARQESNLFGSSHIPEHVYLTPDEQICLIAQDQLSSTNLALAGDLVTV